MLFDLSSQKNSLHMKTYSTYLFDFDYTLADSSRGILKCYRHVLSNNGFTNVTDYAIKRTIGKTLEDSFQEMTGINDPERLSAFKAQYVRHADIHMTANTFFFPETKAVLETLKLRGAQLGIISTKYRYRITETFRKEDADGLLDIIIGGEDVTEHKPSPQGLLQAIKQLGARPQDVLYLGDSIVDALTAQNAGVDFCGILHGATTADELAAYPHVAILNDLNGIM